jgi:uncharacterized protein (DUF1015 family)
VTLLGVALDRLAGVNPDAVAAGAVAYSKSAADVARDGDVMPQKSTYFYPKALTGLVINPHEW